MIRVRWTDRATADLPRIARHWARRNPDMVVSVVDEVYRAVESLAEGRYQAGVALPGLPAAYRQYIERRFGYKIFYRIEGNPPEVLVMLTIRHGRERPLSPSTIRRYGR